MSALTNPEIRLSGEASERDERRRHERLTCVRSCKLLHHGAMRYIAATTSNVSEGGALLCIESDRPIAAGDRVEVGIDWTKRAIVSEERTVAGRVVRVTPMDRHQQLVAVAYDEAVEMAMAA